jgi:hypothetical protein
MRVWSFKKNKRRTSKMANNNLIPVNTISQRIMMFRGEKVMLDKDLASLYKVKPIALRQQVKRNRARFPEDFMFRLSKREVEIMVSQNVIPSKKYFGDYCKMTRRSIKD